MNQPTRVAAPSALVRVFICLHAAVFLAWGLGFYAAPSALAALFDIRLDSGTAVADFRAMYGGLSVGTGLLFTVAVRKQAWVVPALFTITTTSGFLLVGRILTRATEPVGTLIYLIAAMEIVSLVAAVLLLAGMTRSRGMASPVTAAAAAS